MFKFKNVGGHILLLALASLVNGVAVATTDPLNAATNHIVTRTETAAFTLDGVNTGGTEYDVNDRVNVSGSNFIEAQVFSRRYRDPATGDEQLRIYFSVHDIEANGNDRIDFYFDRLHNHGGLADLPAMAEDVLIRVNRADCSPVGVTCTATRFSRDGSGLFSGTGTQIQITDAQVLANNAGEYSGAGAGFNSGWTGELALTPADLEWSYFPQVVGHLIRARSSGQNAISAANPLPSSPANPAASYPTHGGATVDETAAINWSNLKLRYPIDYAVVLDYSGSMLAMDGLNDNRWVRAKRAADLFAAALGLFKPAFDMLDDNIGVSQYSWSCSGNDSSGDTTGAVSGVSGSPGLGNIDDAPGDGDDTLTSGNMDNPVGNNCTPIKRGIEFALANQLNIGAALPNDKRDRIMVLLSDGFHNMPDGDVPFDPETDFSADERDFTQIRTVALGPDGSAGTDLLAKIATTFNGGLPFTFEGKYNQTETFEDLLQAYIETLQAPLTVNQVAAMGSTYSPGAPDKLVFIRVWDNANDAAALSISLNGSPATPDESIFNTKIGYAAAVFNNPAADGAWQMSGTDGTDFVLADLRILARFLIEQKPYAAGDTMLLQVNLKDKGQPLSGANVSVEIAKPGEGLGNYLSTVQTDCTIGKPAIPKNDNAVYFKNMDANSPGVAAGDSAAAVTTGMAGAVSTRQGDPKPLRYQLAARHFERCHKKGLDRENLPGSKLFDDGTHGDLVANDGIYSLAYIQTTLEGSYTFRFFAVGATSDGVDFSRMRTTSQYVGIEPSPAATEAVLQPGAIVNGMSSLVVYFLPKDAFGNYMGPGFKHNFKLSTSLGQMVGELSDLNNGYYAQAVRYPGTIKPVITIATTDGRFEKTVGVDEGGTDNAMNKWLVWIIVLLSILLVWCWLKHRK